MSKKILIISLLSTEKNTGVGIYIKHLVRQLQISDNLNQYYIICNQANSHLFEKGPANFHFIKVHVKEYSKVQFRLFYSIWQALYLNKYINKYKIDIVHFPSPWFINCKTATVVTVHDIVEMHFNKYISTFNNLKILLIKNAIRNASRIISVSESTHKDIIRNFGVAPTLILNGFSNRETMEIDHGVDLSKNGLLQKKKYFIFIGTLIKHKNIINLIKAYYSLSNYDFKLVIVGNHGNSSKSIYKIIRELKLAENVTITGYVTDIARNTLLLNAFSLVLPSTIEGFGFPILEAQSLGIPVITSNNSSMKEIIGNDTLLINPNNYEDIASKMKLLINDQLLYKNIVEVGYSNLKRFSWEKNAKEVINLYSGIL